MKNLFVHSLALPRSENKSARRMKQAALVVALLLPAVAAAQRFPDATELLANVRLRQSQQEIYLHGQLRQETKIVPFHLAQKGPGGRYIFTSPDETLQARIGANDSRPQKIENRWYLKRMRVERIDPQSGRVTARTYLEINK